MRAPASAGALVPAAVSTSTELTKMLDRIDEIAGCYENEDCNYPQTDTRSYYFAVGQDLKQQLETVTTWAITHQEKSPELVQLARTQLENEDGHVQKAALALLATQETSTETLEAILAQVLGGYDAQLIQIALRELLRYQNEDDRSKITTALADTLVTGAPFVAQEVSKSIQPFVYPRSVPNFENAANQLPEGSVIRHNVLAALENFRR